MRILLRRLYLTVLGLIWSLPILLVASMMLAGFSAQAEIGHWPRGSIDDPGAMGPIVRTFINLSFILFISLIASVIPGIVWTCLYMIRYKNVRLAVLATGGFAALCLFGIWFAFIDPLGIIGWMLD
jgi:hypothetical protein